MLSFNRTSNSCSNVNTSILVEESYSLSPGNFVYKVGHCILHDNKSEKEVFLQYVLGLGVTVATPAVLYERNEHRTIMGRTVGQGPHQMKNYGILSSSSSLNKQPLVKYINSSIDKPTGLLPTYIQ